MAHDLVAQLRVPTASTLAGNAFFTSSNLALSTTYDAGHFEMVNGVDSRVNGTVFIPNEISTTAPSVRLICSTTATTGNVVLNLGFLRVGASASFNQTFVTSTSQTVVVPATAQFRFDVIFTANLTTPVALDEILLQVFRNGANAADTLAANLWLWDVVFTT